MPTNAQRPTPRPSSDAPADLSPYADGPSSAGEADPSADGTEQYVVMENRETGETQVARDADVASLPQDGYDEVGTHDTQSGAEDQADASA